MPNPLGEHPSGSNPEVTRAFFTRRMGPDLRWVYATHPLDQEFFRWGHAGDDDPATEEFATMSSFTLLPGQLKLKVGVVSKWRQLP